MDSRQHADADQLALFYQYFDPTEMLQGLEAVAPGPVSSAPPAVPEKEKQKKKRGRPRLHAEKPPKAKRCKREVEDALLPAPGPGHACPAPAPCPPAATQTSTPPAPAAVACEEGGRDREGCGECRRIVYDVFTVMKTYIDSHNCKPV